MSRRWAIASDLKLLARIARQEAEKNAKLGMTQVHKPEVPIAEAKKGPSAATLRAKRVATNNQDSRLDSMVYCPVTGTLTISFPGAMLLSLNTSLRMHDSKATAVKGTWCKRVEALLFTDRATFTSWKEGARFPVVIEEVYATGENRCLDSEAVTAACKPIIDALVQHGFLPDDSPAFVAQPVGYTYRQKPSGLVIRFRPAPKPWGLITDEAMQAAESLLAPLPV